MSGCICLFFLSSVLYTHMYTPPLFNSMQFYNDTQTNETPLYRGTNKRTYIYIHVYMYSICHNTLTAFVFKY